MKPPRVEPRNVVPDLDSGTTPCLRCLRETPLRHEPRTRTLTPTPFLHLFPPLGLLQSPTPPPGSPDSGRPRVTGGTPVVSGPRPPETDQVPQRRRDPDREAPSPPLVSPLRKCPTRPRFRISNRSGQVRGPGVWRRVDRALRQPVAPCASRNGKFPRQTTGN